MEHLFVIVLAFLKGNLRNFEPCRERMRHCRVVRAAVIYHGT